MTYVNESQTHSQPSQEYLDFVVGVHAFNLTDHLETLTCTPFGAWPKDWDSKAVAEVKDLKAAVDRANEARREVGR